MLRLKELLFPWPPRALRWRRPVQLVLRTIHVLSMAVVLGGIAFGVAAGGYRTAFLFAAASGVLLLAVDLARSGVYLWTGAGLATLAKLALLGLGYHVPAHRWPLFLAATVVASVGSHMSGAWRHWSLLDRKVLRLD